jgi:hypothetical protein
VPPPIAHACSWYWTVCACQHDGLVFTKWTLLARHGRHALFLLSSPLQKIDWSWWAIFAPAYGPLYLFVVLACGMCGLRIAAFNSCELLNDEATCAIPVRGRLHIPALVCLGPSLRKCCPRGSIASHGGTSAFRYFHVGQFSRKFGQRLNKRRALSLCLALVTLALVATWFVTMALKMERTWDVSWVKASLPLWVAFGLSLLFAISTICADKPAYGALPLVRCLLNFFPVCVGLIPKASQEHRVSLSTGWEGERVGELGKVWLKALYPDRPLTGGVERTARHSWSPQAACLHRQV